MWMMVVVVIAQWMGMSVDSGVVFLVFLSTPGSVEA